jgi:hypothetical protein
MSEIKYSYNPAIKPGMDKDEAGRKSIGWIFTSTEWDKDKIEEMIRTRAYLASMVKDGHKIKDNVIAIYNIILDFDAGHPTLQEFLQLTRDYRFRFIVHTTVNHQKGDNPKDKFRVIIPLKESIQEEDLMAVAKIWCKRFPTLDPTSFQGSRYYMVNPNAEVFIHDSIINSTGQTEELNFLDPYEAKMLKAASKSKTINLAAKIQELKEGTFTPELEVETSSGQVVCISDIHDKTQIICPFCDQANRQHPDKHNAFVDINDKSKRFLYCSSEDKTYWECDTPEDISKVCENFWSYSTSVYEAGMVSDIFSLENISEKKFYVKVGAISKESKGEYFDHLVTHKHLHRLNRIDNIGDVTLDESAFEFNKKEGNITVKVRALPVDIQDNSFIEDYLTNVFGVHKKFIKEWLAVYVNTNYKKLPTIILTGERGVGKNTFAEAIQAIFPILSETAKDLEGNFNGFAEKKLLIIDESASNGKVQYQMLKKFSGQKFMEVNHKYLRQYQVQNNLNIIFLSNDVLPIYVERDEIPTDTRNNQFFVYNMKPHAAFDATLQDKIIMRLGHWVRSELKSVFESLNLDGYRYSIDVPITPEEQKLFNNSVTDIEAEADRIIDLLETRIAEPFGKYSEFARKGIIPSTFFDEVIQNYKVNKIKVIQNLQKRGYVTNDPAQRYQQISGQRPYSYKLGPKVSVPFQTNSHLDSQTDTFSLEFAEAC